MSRRSALLSLGLLAASVLCGCTSSTTPNTDKTTPPEKDKKETGKDKGGSNGAEEIKPPRHQPG